MAFTGAVAKNIYSAFYELLDSDSTFDYFRTKQRAFYPLDEENLNPRRFPWVFIEYGGLGDIEPYAAPGVWRYQFTLACIAMTFAERGDPTELVFRTGTGNKGIGDIVQDITSVFWTQKKENRFGVDGVKNWTIGRVGVPGVLSIQRLLTNPMVRGVQIDFVFDIVERT